MGMYVVNQTTIPSFETSLIFEYMNAVQWFCVVIGIVAIIIVICYAIKPLRYWLLGR